MTIMQKVLSIFKPTYFNVYAMYDMTDRYLFAVKRKEANEEDVIDPWYTIDKATLKIKGFLPFEDKQGFQMALNHPVKEMK